MSLDVSKSETLISKFLYKPCISSCIFLTLAVLQRWSRSDGDVHRHRQHAAANRRQEHSQCTRLPQTHTHPAQLPGPDWGEDICVNETCVLLLCSSAWDKGSDYVIQPSWLGLLNQQITTVSHSGDGLNPDSRRVPNHDTRLLMNLLIWAMCSIKFRQNMYFKKMFWKN